MVLAALALVLHSLGAPLGQPVAEDFDFLHQALLVKENPFFGGGGSESFWRPIPHQLYYELLGELILDRPWIVPVLHTTLLTLAMVLVWAMLRRSLPSSWAAAAASFPLLQESTRAIIAWPGLSVELGLILFSSLALFEASRRRMATAMGALLLALLCKEVAVVTAALLPFMPGLAEKRRTRWSWAVAVSLVVAMWAVTYFIVRRRLNLTLPHHMETQTASGVDRLIWAVANSVRGNFSLPQRHSPLDPWIGGALLLLAAAIAAFFALDRRARASLRLSRPWISWGAAWFAASATTLMAVYPMWMPHRTAFGGIGLGLVLAILAGAAHRWLLAALVAARLGAFALSPGPPRTITAERVESGAFVDFAQLVRLERLMAETRGALKAIAPRLPAGSRVGQPVDMPHAAEYAYSGSRALQVWYRDTTLRWVRYKEHSPDSVPPLLTILQLQYHRRPQITRVDPLAMEALSLAWEQIQRSEWPAAMASLDRAEAEQHDPRAAVFLSRVAGKRAVCLAQLMRIDAARREADRALALWPANRDARYALAALWSLQGRDDLAEAQLDSVLADYPGDSTTRVLRERMRSEGASPSK